MIVYPKTILIEILEHEMMCHDTPLDGSNPSQSASENYCSYHLLLIRTFIYLY